MDISCKAAKLAVVVVAVIGWLTLFGATLHRVVTDTHSQVCGAVSLVSAVVAITATVVVTILHTIPSLFDAWTEGVEYGQRQAALRAREVPTPGRRLTSVR